MTDQLSAEFLTEAILRLEVEAFNNRHQANPMYKMAFLKAYFMFLENPDLNSLYINNPAYLANKGTIDEMYRFFNSFESQIERSDHIIAHIKGMF